MTLPENHVISGDEDRNVVSARHFDEKFHLVARKDETVTELVCDVLIKHLKLVSYS